MFKKKICLKRKYIWIVFVVMVAGVGGELFARYILGLGTPPLLVTHPKIEYMFKPDQDIYRFGNHILINHYGMRTEPFATQSKEELRIMIFGDSVLNGGSQTDHAALATTLLQKKLAEKTGRKTVVGNISAGSWGPGNWLAYADEYGFFGANIVALVISSHDYADNPTFQPLNPKTHPTQRPAFALWEGVTKYLPRYLPQGELNGNITESDHFSDWAAEQEAQKALNDLKKFLESAKKNSQSVLVFQHWEKEELEQGNAKPGNQRIKKVCESVGISLISLEPYFRDAIQHGNNPYRDNIHPNQIGQQLIAKAFFENILKTNRFAKRSYEGEQNPSDSTKETIQSF